MASKPRTFTDLLRKWPTAVALSEGLAAHGCVASDVLVRRWWNEEMLPPRAWRAFVALAQTAGYPDITLELLAQIAETPIADRRAVIAEGRQTLAA